MKTPAAPLPPKWAFPNFSRLLYAIPSVPELEDYRNRCLAYTFLFGLEAGIGTGWYSAYRALELAEQALDDARWRLACESWRWLRESACPEDPCDDFWWVMATAIAAQRYIVMNVIGGYPPGKTLAVRPTTEVVA